MSRGYSKLYSRKLNNGSQASIQFDKLFQENSNRPSAAKSAGTIGRWGVISCTSLRSTNINGRRDEPIGNKKVHLDFSCHNSSNGQFPFNTDPESRAVAERQQQQVVKPKKFFKSRNNDPEEIIPYGRSNRDSSLTQGTRKYSKSQSSGSKKFFTSAAGKTSDSSSDSSAVQSPPKPAPPPPQREENKPPIVLRIFKGTSHLVNTSVHQSSNKPASDINSVIVRRKRSHDGEYQVSVVNTSSRDTSSHTSITAAPKRSARETRSKSAESRDYHVENVYTSVKQEPIVKLKVERKVESMKTEATVQPEETPAADDAAAPPDDTAAPPDDTAAPPDDAAAPPVDAAAPLDDVERAVAALESGKDLDSVSANMSGGSTSCDVPITSGGLPPSLCYPSSQDTAFSVPSSVEPTNTTSVISSVGIQPAVPDANVEKEDQEKLLKAEELLAETYMDFSSTAEKLLQLPQQPSTVVPGSAVEGKTFPEHDWFSDSEGSNSILDQINTLAASEAEVDRLGGSAKTDRRFQMEPRVAEDSLSVTQELTDAQSLPATQEVEGKGELEPEQEPDQETEQEPEQEMEIIPGRELRSGRTSSPATRKGSIFKSRSLLSDGPRQRRAVYKHKWADTEKEAGAGASQPSSSTVAGETSVQPAAANMYDIEEEFELGKLTRVTTWPTVGSDGDMEDLVTRVRCSKKDKEYYTVVRNVKKAHQIQESGEFQEFNDDVEYILDALQDNYPIGTRCLSAITLASKCMAPAFRMHVRAHGTVTKFFRALHDATKDQSLALCTATVMFVLSQDRLNMDLDRHSLELMLNLLESDASHRNALDDCGMSSSQLHKNKQRVRELCAEIQGQGHAKHLNLDNITAGQLAMETLLSLTSRRAGEWFKEELRELGGLEHIVKTISECCRHLDVYIVQWTDPLLDKLRKVDRCLRVLENVTHQHEENQLYLLNYENGILVDILFRLYCQCDSQVSLYPVLDDADKESTGAVIREALLATLKVLINLSHDFNNRSYGSTLVGQRRGIVDTSLHVLLQVPYFVPEQKKFDLLVLALILLINLAEHSEPNRKLLFEAKIPDDEDSLFETKRGVSAVEALIGLFYEQEQLARAEEVKTDAILDGKKDVEEPEAEAAQPKSHEEFIEETVAKLLQKAGRNMEHTLIGAYIGLLLGYLIIDNREYELFVRQCLPEGNFRTIIAVLQKVYNFMNLTASAVGSSRGIAQTERVINCLIKSDNMAIAAALESSATSCESTFEGNVSMLDDSIS